jgi:hypothetical protein
VVCNIPWYPTDLTFALEAAPRSWPSLTLEAHGDVVVRNTDWDSDLIRPAHTEDPNHERHRLVAHDSPFYGRLVGIEPKGTSWVDDEDQVPLWPERWNWEVLEKKRFASVNPSDYLRSYRCVVRDDETAPVRLEWIVRARELATSMRQDSSPPRDWPPGLPAFVGVDPAFGQEKHHDKSSIFAFGVLPSGHRRILEVQVGRWKASELLTRIVDVGRRYGAVVCVEGNAGQKMIRDWARERAIDVPVRTLVTGKNKGNPLYGVQTIFAEVENGTWLFPHDNGRPTPGVAQLEYDLLYYDPAKHTGDALMSMWIAREYARKVGALVVGGPDGGGSLSAALAR